MDTSLPRSAEAAAAASRPPLAPPAARSILVTGILVGVAADALLRGGPLGAAFPLWIAVLVLNLASLVSRAGAALTREARLWLAAALLFSLGTAWRNAGALDAVDVLATAFCLGMAVVVLANRRAGLLAGRVRDTAAAGFRAIQSVAAGTLSLVFREARLEDALASHGRRGVALARSAAVAALLLVVFGALLRGADPIFASFIALPTVDPGVVASHLVLTGFFTWITAGWARAALAPSPGARPAPSIALAARDAFTALATLDLLFAAFVLAQLGWLFGGDAYLRARTGLTIADYARRGFFQIVWVVALAVPILLVTRAMLPADRAARRRHTALALPLVALLGGVMISAVARLKLYVSFYGLTTDRFYALAILGWLAAVVAWLVVTVLRDHGRPFAAGAVLSAFGALVVLNIVDPDAIVARVNVDRFAPLPAAGVRPSLDLAHLATLRGGAVPIAVREVLRPSRLAEGTAPRLAEDAQRCAAANRLLHEWGPASRLARRRAADGAWRTWNADDAVDAGLVAEHAGAIRAVAHAACRPGQR